jgi:hypothetical protein
MRGPLKPKWQQARETGGMILFKGSKVHVHADVRRKGKENPETMKAEALNPRSCAPPRPLSPFENSQNVKIKRS